MIAHGNIILKSPTNYTSYLVRNFEKSLKEFSSISDKIKPYFIINGFNYWDLLSYFLWYSSSYFKGAPGIDIIMNFIDDLEEDLGTQNDRVSVELNDLFSGTYLSLAKKVCIKKKCTIVKINKIKKTLHAEVLYQNTFIIRSLLKARIRSRQVIGLLRRISGKNNTRKGDVLLLSNIRFIKSKKSRSVLFENIMTKLSESGTEQSELLYEELIQTTNLKRFIKNFIQEKNKYIGDYYIGKVFRENKKDFRILLKKWKQIRYNEQFRSIFNYKGYDFYDEIKPRLEIIFKALSCVAYDAKNITQSIIDKEGYKVLVIDHEENLYAKAFMLNTRFDKKRKTVALSHELIYPGCAHTHIKNDKELDKKSSYWRPLPDVKCVWGVYAQKVLLETCNYRSELVKITGNPRLDDAKNREYDAQKLAIKFKLSTSNNCRKVLIISDGNTTKYDVYLRLPEKIPGYDFVFKPHHYDDERLLREKFSSAPKNFFIMEKYAEIYELICACDYVLIFTSSVGFEAMMFDKPVIIFDPEKLYIDYLPYLKFKAAIKTSNADELSKVLKYLEEKKNRDRILNNSHNFVNALNYKNDGKASERIANEIRKFL